MRTQPGITLVESMLMLPLLGLLMAGLIQGLWIWGTHNRLQDVALLAARQSAADYSVSTARIRAAELGLDPRVLVFDTEHNLGRASVTANYPLRPRWVAASLLWLGGTPWLSVTAQAHSQPSVQRPPLR